MSESLVVVWEIWDHLKARLNTARMQQLLGGPARVYRVTDDFRRPEGAEDVVWHRLVIVPTTTLWNVAHAPGKTRKVGFLVRAESHAPQGITQYNAARALDAIQLEANAQLQGYVPPPDTMNRVMVALPIYLWTEPQPVPLWDDTRGVTFTSAEYRMEAARRPGA